jgi:hypothetical protein
MSPIDSPYYSIYEIIIPDEHEFRRLLELTDFTSVRSLVEKNYCTKNGKNGTDPVLLFKCLFLKVKAKLSDRDLVS